MFSTEDDVLDKPKPKVLLNISQWIIDKALISKLVNKEYNLWIEILIGL